MRLLSPRHIAPGTLMNLNRIALFNACSLAAAVFIGTQAHAASIGDLTVYGYVEGGGALDIPSTDAPGTVRLGPAFATLETSPGAAVLASTPTTPADVGAYEAVGQISYYAEILGPTVDSPIPLRLYYDLKLRGDGPSSTLSAGLNFDGLDHVVSVYDGLPAVSESTYLTQGEVTNSPFKISIDASSIGGGTSYVDPMLEIDPDWALANPELANQVSLSFSDGAQNGLGDLVASAPEPATWAMMLVGFGLAGWQCRRAQRRQTMEAAS